MGICESNTKKNNHAPFSQQVPEEAPKKENLARKPSLSLAFNPISLSTKKEEIKKYFNLMNSIGKGTYGLVREGE